MKVKYYDLENKRVFITGGGSGIGASIVEHFCEQGSEVYFIDIKVSEAEKLIEDIKNELILTWIDLTKQSDEVYRFKFVYDIENISDWVELQNRLQSVRLLEQYKPSLFTTDKVEGYVDFLGNGDKFVLLLSQNKINAVNLGPYYRISLDD